MLMLSHVQLYAPPGTVAFGAVGQRDCVDSAAVVHTLLWQPEWTKHSHICPPEQSPNLTAQALEPHVAPQPTYHLRLPVRFFMLQPNEKAPALCFLHFLQPSPHLSLLKSDSSSTWDVLLAPKAQESKT